MVKLEKVQSFEQLTVWQDSMALAEDVYQATKKFPSSEQFALTDQVRRAVVSISTNIAEGFGRSGQKEKLHFYSICYGSLLEVKSLLYLSERLGYMTAGQVTDLNSRIEVLQKQINSMTRSIKGNA